KARLFREVDEKTGDTSADLEKYLKHCEKIYNIAAETFMFKSLGEKSTILGKDGLKTMARIGGMDVRRTMHEANASFFSDPKMVQLFDRYGTYNGSNPYKMPGTFNLIQHVEYGFGGYAPHGGIYSIPLALEKLCRKMGVEFRYATKAKKIILECKKVTGVKTEQGEVLEGDIVVSNSDVSNTYRVLIGDGDSKGAQRYEKLEPSSSAMVFYWGINREFSELGVHNIFFSGDYKKEFNQIFDEKRCPEDPTIYINITSKYEPDDAPAGKENWFVMINTPYVSGQNWKKEMGEVRERILRRLSSELGEDVEGLVECEATLSPPDIESRTSSNRGSIYGISSNTRNAAFLRQQNRSKEYPGLYFAGGSAHPGGGMPLAILSGKIAADLANKYQ
ncbi:MAG: phytoene desaturase family protein, partial [Candidatus Thermoplasmatota archaeon]|nr:phytoene desaturase family protein [Candidatus Thermoplasmatota archaeon]